MREAVLLCVIIYCCWCVHLVKSTTISSDIAVDTTFDEANSPYKIATNVSITAKLTIHPNVVLLMNEMTSLTVLDGGSIVSQGIQTGRVTIQSSSDPVAGFWGQIVFMDTAQGTTFDSQGQYVSGSILAFTDILHGASHDEPVLVLDHIQQLLITDCSISASSKGLQLESASATVVNTEIDVTSSPFTSSSSDSHSNLNITHSAILNTAGKGTQAISIHSRTLDLYVAQCDMSQASVQVTAQDGQLTVLDNEFQELRIQYQQQLTSGTTRTIERNTFERLEYFERSNATTSITHNQFHTTMPVVMLELSVKDNAQLIVEHNEFKDAVAATALAISADCNTAVYFRNNTFHNVQATKLIELQAQGIVDTVNCTYKELAFNTVTNTTTSMLLHVVASGFTVAGNVFDAVVHNSLVINTAGTSQYVANNYWGTSSASEIRAKISDMNVNLRFGYVSFSPFLTTADIEGATSSEAADPFIITGHVVWSGTKQITRSVWIDKNSKLTITEGTQVLFSDNKGILVDGTLIVQGTSSNRVLFNASNSQWSGIRFSQLATMSLLDIDISYISGSLIRYATFDLQDLSGTAIDATGNPRTILVEYSSISNTAYCVDAQTAVVRDSKLHARLQTIRLRSTTSSTIANNVITSSNGYGVFVNFASVTNNLINAKFAVYVRMNGKATISGNTIIAESYGISAYGSQNLVVDGNTFERNNVGLQVSLSSATEQLLVTGNTIRNTSVPLFIYVGNSEANVVVERNIFEDNSGSAVIRLLKTSRSNSTISIERNSFTGNAGTNIESNADVKSISYNNFMSSENQFDIYYTGESNVACEGNYWLGSVIQSWIQDRVYVNSTGTAFVTFIRLVPDFEAIPVVAWDTTWESGRSIDLINGLDIASPLTILPEVTVMIGAGKNIRVNSTIMALGHSQNQIRFVAKQNEPWGQILFSSVSQQTIFDSKGAYVSGSILAFAQFINGGSNNRAAVHVKDIELMITDCTFSGSFIGLEFESANLTIANSIFDVAQTSITGSSNIHTRMNITGSTATQGDIYVTLPSSTINLSMTDNNFQQISTIIMAEDGSLDLRSNNFNKFEIRFDLQVYESSTTRSIQQNTFGVLQYIDRTDATTIIRDNIFQAVNGQETNLLVFSSKSAASKSYIENNQFKNSVVQSACALSAYCATEVYMTNNTFYNITSDTLIELQGQGIVDELDCKTKEWTNNTVTNTTTSMLLHVVASGFTVAWNVFDAVVHNSLVINTAGTSQYVANNYWGTSSSSEIRSKIYDMTASVAYGYVSFSPFLTTSDISGPTENEPTNPFIVTASTTWSGVRYITGSILVRENVVLSLAVDTQLLFSDGTGILVDGTLSVPFGATLNTSNNHWSGIRFSQLATSTSRLSHVNIDKVASTLLNGAVQVDTPNQVTIEYTSINSEPSCVHAHSVLIRDSTLSTGQSTAVSLRSKNQASTIMNSLIFSSGYALQLLSGFVTNNTLTSKYGIFVRGDGDVQITENTLVSSIISLTATNVNSLLVKDNLFTNATLLNIDLTANAQTDNITISGNTITNTKYPITIRVYNTNATINIVKNIITENVGEAIRLNQNVQVSNANIFVESNFFRGNTGAAVQSKSVAVKAISYNSFLASSSAVDVYYGAPSDFSCEGNYWQGSADRSYIAQRIFDHEDDSIYGSAILSFIRTDAQIGSDVVFIWDTNWIAAHSPYYIKSNASILSELTIGANVLVLIGSDVTIRVVDGGSLITQGTQSERVIIQSFTDASAGSWGQIVFMNTAKTTVLDSQGDYVSGSMISYTDIYHGGSEDRAVIVVDGSSLLMSDLTLRSSSKGVQLIQANATIINSHIDVGSSPVTAVNEYSPLHLHMTNTAISNTAGTENQDVKLSAFGSTLSLVFVNNSMSDISLTISADDGYLRVDHNTMKDLTILLSEETVSATRSIQHNKLTSLSFSDKTDSGSVIRYNEFQSTVATASLLSASIRGSMSSYIEFNQFQNSNVFHAISVSAPCSASVFVRHNTFDNVQATKLIELQGQGIVDETNCAVKELTYNTVTNTTTSMLLHVVASGFTVAWNVFDAVVHNSLVINTAGTSQYVANNYWGTSSSSEIRSKIYDLTASVAYGYVVFSPFLTTSDIEGATSSEATDPFIITGHVVWSGVKYVTGSVWIVENATLTLTEGTQVLFSDNKGMVVDGTLVVQGTSSNRVLFNASNSQWSGFRFSQLGKLSNIDSSGSYISGSLIRHAALTQIATAHLTAGIVVDVKLGSIFIDSISATMQKPCIFSVSSVHVKDSVLQCTTYGVYSRSTVEPSIVHNNTITANTYTIQLTQANITDNTLISSRGVYVRNSGRIHLRRNNIQSTSATITAPNFEELLVEDNILSNPHWQGMDILVRSASKYLSVTGNKFVNSSSPIYISVGLSNATIVISDNVLEDTTGDAIHIVEAYAGSNTNIAIERNVFRNTNGNAVVTKGIPIQSISFNSFVNSKSDFDVYYAASGDFQAECNYWNGITNQTAIGERLFDYLDEPSHGSAQFSFIRAEPEIDSPYVVAWDLILAQDRVLDLPNGLDIIQPATLTIQPGVTLKVGQGKNIRVNATLIAVGSSGHPIIFTNRDSALFGSLYFTSDAISTTVDGNGEYLSGSVLNNIRIENAGLGTNGALIVSGPFLLVSHVQIHNSDSYGAYFSSGVRMTDTWISQTSGISIQDEQGSSQVFDIIENLIEHSSSDRCMFTADIPASRTLNLVGNTFRSGTCAGNIQFAGSVLTVEGNSWSSFTESGISIVVDAATASAVVTGNTINNTRHAIHLTQERGQTQFDNNQIDSCYGNFIASFKASDQCNDVIRVSNNILTNSNMTGDADWKTVIRLHSAGDNCQTKNLHLRNNTIQDTKYEDASDTAIISVLGTSVEIKRNLVYENAAYLLRTENPPNTNISATENYWSPLYGDAIRSQFYDMFKNSSIGRILFAPYLLDDSVDADLGSICSSAQFIGLECDPVVVASSSESHPGHSPQTSQSVTAPSGSSLHTSSSNVLLSGSNADESSSPDTSFPAVASSFTSSGQISISVHPSSGEQSQNQRTISSANSISSSLATSSPADISFPDVPSGSVQESQSTGPSTSFPVVPTTLESESGTSSPLPASSGIHTSDSGSIQSESETAASVSPSKSFPSDQSSFNSDSAPTGSVIDISTSVAPTALSNSHPAVSGSQEDSPFQGTSESSTIDSSSASNSFPVNPSDSNWPSDPTSPSNIPSVHTTPITHDSNYGSNPESTSGTDDSNIHNPSVSREISSMQVPSGSHFVEPSGPFTSSVAPTSSDSALNHPSNSEFFPHTSSGSFPPSQSDGSSPSDSFPGVPSAGSSGSATASELFASTSTTASSEPLQPSHSREAASESNSDSVPVISSQSVSVFSSQSSGVSGSTQSSEGTDSSASSQISIESASLFTSATPTAVSSPSESALLPSGTHDESSAPHTSSADLSFPVISSGSAHNSLSESHQASSVAVLPSGSSASHSHATTSISESFTSDPTAPSVHRSSADVFESSIPTGTTSGVSRSTQSSQGDTSGSFSTSPSVSTFESAPATSVTPSGSSSGQASTSSQIPIESHSSQASGESDSSPAATSSETDLSRSTAQSSLIATTSTGLTSSTQNLESTPSSSTTYSSTTYGESASRTHSSTSRPPISPSQSGLISISSSDNNYETSFHLSSTASSSSQISSESSKQSSSSDVSTSRLGTSLESSFPIETSSDSPVSTSEAQFSSYRASSSVLMCFGLPATDFNVCGGHGTCASHNNCSCIVGFQGETCSRVDGGDNYTKAKLSTQAIVGISVGIIVPVVIVVVVVVIALIVAIVIISKKPVSGLVANQNLLNRFVDLDDVVNV